MIEIESKLLELLNEWKDWWYGWDEVCQVLGAYEELAREVMYSLKKKGLVEARAIFTDDLKLNGKGWFAIKT